MGSFILIVRFIW